MSRVFDGTPRRGLVSVVCPVTALRKTERVERGEHKPPTCEHGEWTFAGADFKRKATKWRCPPASASPRHGGSRPIDCTR